MSRHILYRKSSFIVSLLSAACSSSSIFSGGIYLSEYGTQKTALAGAGSAARAQDASTLFTRAKQM